MAFVSRFLNQILVFFWIVYMVAIRYEVTQVFGVFIASAFLVTFGVFGTHSLLLDFIGD
jgi:hypothetical protein